MLKKLINPVRGECFANTKCEQNVSNHELKIHFFHITTLFDPVKNFMVFMVRYKFSQQTSCFENSLTTNGIIRFYWQDKDFRIIGLAL
jgi:hypothetical protein